MYFWKSGLLIRGGISVGTYFSDELMIWGKGLVKTYQLENQIAVYPRIIIDPKDKKLFAAACEPFGNVLLNEDFDGICFVDPFLWKDIKRHENMLRELLCENVKQLKAAHKKDFKIEQKLLWFNRYLKEKISILETEKHYME